MDLSTLIRPGATLARSRWPAMGGLAWVAALGWFAFVRSTRVPLLGLVDLGFHELGHLVTAVLPVVLTAMAGSVAQVAVPAGLFAYFTLGRREWANGAVCLAWAGTSAQDVSVYIADAPYQALPLIGGQHDWAFILGPDHLDALGAASSIAAAVRLFGLVLLVAAAGVCLVHLLSAAPRRPALSLPTGMIDTRPDRDSLPLTRR